MGPGASERSHLYLPM